MENTKMVIVRSADAGVQCGHLVRNEGDTVYLKDARQMWQWKAAQGGTLLDCATFGVETKGSRFSKSSVTMTVFRACAIIDVTPEAAATFEVVSW